MSIIYLEELSRSQFTPRQTPKHAKVAFLFPWRHFGVPIWRRLASTVLLDNQKSSILESSLLVYKFISLKVNMRKIILWIILGLVLILLIIFGWRFFHYYQLVKKGGSVAFESSSRFTKSQTAGSASSAASANLLRTGAPELGNPQASLTIVEFADFTCSYSHEVFSSIRELLVKYPDEIRFVFRFFPVDSSASQVSEEAAGAALCAAEQNKFWAYHDKLFQNQKSFMADDLKDYARQVGLNEEQFNLCLETKKYQADLTTDYKDGLSAGVQGTPTFFVNGQKVEGAVPLEAWEKALRLTESRK